MFYSSLVSGFLKELDLYIKDDEPTVVTLAGFPLLIFCLSLWNAINFLKDINNYHYIQSKTRVIHLLNEAQFLNATLVLALPPVAVISPVKRTYESE